MKQTTQNSYFLFFILMLLGAGNVQARCHLHTFKAVQPIVVSEKTFIDVGALIGLNADCKNVNLPRLHIRMRSEYTLAQLYVSNALTKRERVYVNSTVVDLQGSPYAYTFPLSDRFNRLDEQTRLELYAQGQAYEILSIEPEIVR